MKEHAVTYKAVTLRGISAGMAVKLLLVQSTSPRAFSSHTHGPQRFFEYDHPSTMLRSERNTAMERHNTAITQAKLSGFVALVYDLH